MTLSHPATVDPLTRRSRALWWAKQHPVLLSASLAAAARLACVVVGHVLHPGSIFNDEAQYVALARAVAAGRDADSWFPHYGQSLYDSTWAFVAPLRLLFDLVGPERIIGQLFAAVAGVTVAALVARLALEIADRRVAVVTGAVAALLPSQVLWSSVVLRESLVWLALVAIALAIAAGARASGWSLTGWAALGVTGLLMLGNLRGQTLIAAAWSAPVAVALAGGRRTAVRVAGAAIAALLVPVLIGAGPLGLGLVGTASDSLAQTRTNFGFEANSRLTNPVAIEDAEVVEEFVDERCRNRGAGAVAIACAPRRVVRTADGRQITVVRDRNGGWYEVDEGVGSTIAYIPKGFVAFVLRPFPWEHGTRPEASLAAIESIAWYVLYAGAVVGTVAAGWRQRRVLAFPILVSALVVGIASVTQGNVGTAFRHRGQVLWALALLAAVGLAAVIDRRALASAR